MKTENWQILLIQLLTIPGALIAFYLLLFHNGTLVAACSGRGWDDCGLVSGPNAPYASIGPVPVALIGLVGYLLIFLLIWLKEWLTDVKRLLPELLVGVSAIALLFSLWLTGLEAFVIHAFCRFCLLSAGLVIIIFALSASYLRQVNRA